MVKLDLGLRIATLDLGGWDTHENQGTTAGVYAALATELAQGLRALWHDLDDTTSYVNRLDGRGDERVRPARRAELRQRHRPWPRQQSAGDVGARHRRLHGTWPGLHPTSSPTATSR